MICVCFQVVCLRRICVGAISCAAMVSLPHLPFSAVFCFYLLLWLSELCTLTCCISRIKQNNILSDCSMSITGLFLFPFFASQWEPWLKLHEMCFGLNTNVELMPLDVRFSIANFLTIFGLKIHHFISVNCSLFFILLPAAHLRPLVPGYSIDALYQPTHLARSVFPCFPWFSYGACGPFGLSKASWDGLQQRPPSTLGNKQLLIADVINLAKAWRLPLPRGKFHFTASWTQHDENWKPPSG